MQSKLFKLNRWLTGLVILGSVILPIGGCVPANQLPVITSLKAKQNVIAPLDSCLIECVASDEDGDELTYEWSASKGNITGAGATVAWSAPVTEGIYSIVVKVADGNEGEATDSMTITVKDNHLPEIISLVANAEWVTPASSCRIKCKAEDPDGDELSYEWSASGGDISGTGSVVNWTGPEGVGLCYITVAVNDGYGGQSTRSLSISVVSNPPPVIERLTVTPEEPKYVKEYEGGYRILRNQSCIIECVVKDASDDLVYEWSADEGDISGEGSMIIWTAPDERGEVTVTAIVSDSNGSVTTKSIVFKVETCGCAFN